MYRAHRGVGSAPHHGRRTRPRCPENGCGPPETPAVLILHSDRGSQYASCEFRLALAAARMQQSMSRKANCWDNAPAESFFARFKQECLQQSPKFTHEELVQCVGAYIGSFYNIPRMHSSLGYLSPAYYESRLRHHELVA
ncbi:MAG: hypothetical protein EOO38_26755 [Cytophagaceae bacterium]|nr:MAG: hypothetical protein EOO38_26755 [Cytophagaceae bacterium]